MPVLSDFSVITDGEGEYLAHRNFTGNFDTGGRRDTRGLLDIELLGGYRAGDTNMWITILLNGSSLTSRAVSRWTVPRVLSFDRLNIVIPPGRLRDGNNTLEIRPSWESRTDYAFVGTVVVHFHQAT